jgi:hypothetical protein
MPHSPIPSPGSPDHQRLRRFNLIETKLGIPEDWRFPLMICGAMLGLLAAGWILGDVFLPPGSWHHTGSLGHRLMSWDGLWYERIARSGYSWNPAVGQLYGHYQTTDFYPFFPFVERVLLRVTFSNSSGVLVAVSLIFGSWSVFAFHKLALRLLPLGTARRATAIYGLWPASVFFVMGYPTGLINLLVIAALLAYIDKRFWRAALWIGLGTATAPTLVFVAIALCLDRGMTWLLGGREWRVVPEMVIFGLLSVWGLIAFMIDQFILFHDPFTFIKAQEAWGIPPSFLVRLGRVLNPSWYWDAQVHSIQGIVHHQAMQFNEQYLLNGFSMLLVLAGTIVALRRARPLAVPLAALVGLVCYLWFIATTVQNLQATSRLLYPAAGMFIGLGMIVTRLPRLYPILLAGLGMLTLLNAAALAAGYFLV